MPTAVPTVLCLPDHELPDITDAGVGMTLLLVATLMAERERQALLARVADATEVQDWPAVAALTRRLAAVPGAVSRMADVARAGIERFDAGMGCPEDGPAAAARARRALVRTANWLDRKFWPMYGTVRPVMPPATEDPAPAPAAGPAKADAKACRKAVRGRLYLLDDELARLVRDPRPAADTARVIMTADRNSHAARCRACGACRLGSAPITRDIPAG